MAQSTSGDADQDIMAEVAALHAQVERLLGHGSETAVAMAQEARQATRREVDTLLAQAKSEPVATALFVLAGAILGFVLGRVAR